MSFNFYWRIRDTKGAGGADGLQKGSFRTSGCQMSQDSACCESCQLAGKACFQTVVII